MINPGPDEELLPGDRVLLLGDREQLDAARTPAHAGERAADRQGEVTD